MNARISLAAGILLLALGGVLTLLNLVAESAGLAISASRLWPVSIAALGLLCLIPPMFTPRRRGLTGLYLPGLPLLAVSILGMIGQVWPATWVWGHLWPLMILSVALGFFLMGRAFRSVWLILPAVIVAALGGSLLLTATTGAWWLWAGLWTLMPLSAGLILFLIGTQRRQPNLMMTGSSVVVTSIGVGASLLLAVSGHFNGVVLAVGASLAIIGTVMVGWSLGVSQPPMYAKSK
jgi:hypothetical protein